MAPACFSFGRKLDATRWARGGEKVRAGEMRRAGPRQRQQDGREGGGAPGDSQTLVPLVATDCGASALLSAPSFDPAPQLLRPSEPEEAFGSLLVQLCHLQKRKPRPREML